MKIIYKFLLLLIIPAFFQMAHGMKKTTQGDFDYEVILWLAEKGLIPQSMFMKLPVKQRALILSLKKN